MALTNRNVVFAKPGRHHAGVQGLYLYVTPDQQVRRWIYRYTSPVTKRVTETGLGLVQVLTLAEARSKALDLQKQISQGICPITAKREARNCLPTGHHLVSAAKHGSKLTNQDGGQHPNLGTPRFCC
jgi:hypothetical protein